MSQRKQNSFWEGFCSFLGVICEAIPDILEAIFDSIDIN
jgi:hypothetical protein